MSSYHPGTWQKNAPHAKEYFSENMVDYHSEKGKEIGIWGSGASALGLTGQVKKVHFCHLVDGLHPITGEPLTQRRREDRRCYLGQVLSAPKSFSIASIIGKDERLRKLFDKSVDETMEIASSYGAARVRAMGQDEDEWTGNMIYARFTHDTSRALDPALHSHVATFNVTLTRVGEWKALQTAPLFERRRLFSEIFLGKLASGARELGYEIRQTKDGFELLAIPQELIDMFSKGKQKIDAEMSKLLGSTGEAGHGAVRAVVAHQVRDSKTEISAEALQARWREEMGEDAHSTLMALVGAAKLNRSIPPPPMTPAEALSLAISHLTERNSVLGDHQVQAEALAASRGCVDFNDVKKEMQKPEHGIIYGYPDAMGSQKLTTRELLDAERRVLSFAREGIGQYVSLLPQLGRKMRPRDSMLSDEQKRAVDKLLASRDRVMLLLGKAGTGKSTSQRDLVAGIKTAGHVVIGCAPQARQVAELKQMGLHESRTLASVLEKGELPDGAVVLLDESGQVGTRDFARLVEMIASVNGRLILSGDARQHGSVCAGDVLRLLARHSGCDKAMIKTIRRQQDELYKAAVTLLSKHQSLEAWDMLDAAGKVEEVPAELRHKALAKWVADGLDNKKNMLTVAPTWSEIDLVTEAIRGELIQRGRLGCETRKVTVSERVDMTKAQKKQARCYQVGMEIIELRGLGLRKKRMRIKEIQGETLILDEGMTLDLKKLNRTASWTVHRPREIEVRTGDRLLLQQNDRPSGYHNGDLVTIAGFDADTILLDNGKSITRDYTQFTFGWAVTSYASQGLTCDQVAISYDQGSFRGIDRRGFYVGVSRGRESVRIFVDDKDFVRDCLRRNSGERTTATELVFDSPNMLVQNLRRQRLQDLQSPEVTRLTPDQLPLRTPMVIATEKMPMEPLRQRGR